MHFKWLLPAGAAFAAAFGAASAFADGGTLKIGRDQDSNTLDPIFTIENADIWVLNNMNAKLVEVNEDMTGVAPDLAKSWDISEDKTTYTFHLREGLKFSDGSALTASDVEFSLERLRDEKESVLRSMFQVMEDVKAPDEHTVVIELEHPSAPFLSALAVFSASILPEDVVKERGDDFGTNPVGAGAFKFKTWERGNRIVLEKNPHYHKDGQPKVDEVQWLVEANDNTRILKLQAGEIDAAIFIPFSRVEGLQNDPNVQVHLDPSSREDHVLINHEHPPLDNVKVRRALYHAIDREGIIDAVLFGHGTVATSFVPKGQMFHNPDTPTYDYDPDKARQLLDEAGVEDLTLEIITAAGNETQQQTAVLLQNMLKQVGIELNIVKQEPGQTWDTIVQGEYDLSLNYWTNDIIDPDQKATFSVYGENDAKSYYTRYHNPEVAKLVEKGRTVLDAEKRRDIYYKIQEMAKKDVHWIDLYYSPFRNASHQYVENFHQTPMGRFTLEMTEINK
ncbi:ABC transporter substrate-binding protein [Ferruginivarius sediminum]|nr:ABC transporter substrate-binding protein [Ferruginivarius sediminum]